MYVKLAILAHSVREESVSYHQRPQQIINLSPNRQSNVRPGQMVHERCGTKTLCWADPTKVENHWAIEVVLRVVFIIFLEPLLD